jgi:hypothetical protein
MSPLVGIRGIDMPGLGLHQEPLQPPRVVDRALLVKQLPIVLFGGDIVIPAASDIVIDVNDALTGNCTGLIVTNIVGTVQISINGGGFRTVSNDFIANDSTINSLRVQTAALSGCIVQLHGTV